ncbi:hypothetical protein [Pseudooctadecabacter jejudonensis]|uniref:Uncharacterized protein n=1 Tax=Pseudooctadecabacter jejudonensis TaxID=1391910 RepID=A0A1Y5S1M6_9RHOB|nr:hypothetical protein [Pseudooctadecabacter jejudonensis]SLN30046.1 hypothetical protein PSJ8397_01357 [Pseudooctadecabacter jejudonensis]
MIVRGGWCLAAALVLSGCADMSNGLADRLATLGSSPDATNEGIRTLAVLDGAVRVRGPDGYCIDQGASDASRGFAIMAGCALVSDEAVVIPNPDGLIMVQFGAEGTASVTGNEDAFAAFLRSESGRGVLSSAGDLAQVPQVATVTDRAGVLARFEDTAGPAFEGTSGPQWRGFLDVGSRLTTVSVLSFDRNPLSASAGERLLVVAMAQLAEVNAQPQPDL